MQGGEGKVAERENVEEDMLYGIEKRITLKECIKNEVLIMFLSLLSLVFPVFVLERSDVLCILHILPIILHPIFIVKYRKNILHNAVFIGCIFFIFTIIPIEMVFVLFQGKTRNIIICIVCVGYILIGILQGYLFKKLIKRAGRNESNTEKLKLFSGLGAILGITIAKTFLKDMDERKAMELVCVLLFFLSYIILFAILNLFKFYYLAKHNEKLKGRDDD